MNATEQREILSTADVIDLVEQITGHRVTSMAVTWWRTSGIHRRNSSDPRPQPKIRLPAMRVGGRYVYRRDDVVEFLRATGEQ